MKFLFGTQRLYFKLADYVKGLAETRQLVNALQLLFSLMPQVAIVSLLE